MRNKYHAKKITTADGVFDSKKEYNRWCELKLLYRAGKITDLQRQVPFELIPTQYETYERYTPKNHIRTSDGSRCVERAVKYIADFVYTEDGKTVVEDTKGMRTADYVIKRKLMLWVHGIEIKEI